MSLVTRCPSCSTLFRIVPDQIRVAAGWVRCGHCGEVFDASTHMLPRRRGVTPSASAVAPDIGALATTLPPPATNPPQWPVDDETPPPSTHGPAPGSTQPMDSWPSLSLLPPDGNDGPGKEPAGIGEGPPIDPDPVAALETPAGRQGAGHAGGGNEPVLDDSVDPEPGIESLPSAADPAEPPEQHEGPVAATPTAAPAPSFVVAARRRTFWSSAPMRALSWLALLTLGLGLAAQLVFMQRSWLAARLPSWAPGLQAACAALGCDIGPYRQLDAITIEDSSFLRREGEPFQLSVSLRNGAGLAVASPAIELTLTDADDQAVARRVFTAAELGIPPALATHGQADSTRGIRLIGPVDPQAVAGYRVKAFYP